MVTKTTKRTAKQAKPKRNEIAEAIHFCLVSPNCEDSNLEPANIVDGLYMIAGAIQRLATVIEKRGDTDAKDKT